MGRHLKIFSHSDLRIYKELGNEVHFASNFELEIDKPTDKDKLDFILHDIPFSRSPYSFKNLKAYKKLKKLMYQEKYDLIHCQSPVGGALTRLAAHATKTSPVIYTAHGFHFFKGAPLKNWLIYYPIEKWLARFTDALITINKEDYSSAKKFKAKNTFYIPGIGVDTSKFKSLEVEREQKRTQLGVKKDEIVILSIGELIKRKNHETALRALAKIEQQNIVFLICGRGELEEPLRNLSVSLGIDKKVRFLGFRNDIPEISLASDIFLFPSYQEGLPLSVMEAMSAGLPVVCSKIRGNTDLINDGEGGYLIEPDNIDGFAQAINDLIKNVQLRDKMKQHNKEYIMNFDIGIIKDKLSEIYINL